MFFKKYAFFILPALLTGAVFGCDVIPEESIHDYLKEITLEHDYDSIIKKALDKTAISYKQEAIERLKRFLLASKDIAKGPKSILINKLNYPINRPKPKPIGDSDDVVIILDAGFSDIPLTYADDVIAYYKMAQNGQLIEKKLDFVLPRWAWYLYELQADTGIPHRVLLELVRAKVLPDYPSSNLIKNTDYINLLKKYNSKDFPVGDVIYDKQKSDESAYHGAMVTLTLKEWAPSAKLVLVRYNLANVDTNNELRMLQDLNAIAQKFNAGFLVRSSSGTHHWHGLKTNQRILLENLLIINSALDRKNLEERFSKLRTQVTNHNFIFANTFSTGCSGLKIARNGEGLSSMGKDISKIAEFSFHLGKLIKPMLDNSSVFVNRHACYHAYNTIYDHGSCFNINQFFPIGFNHLDYVDGPCSPKPYFLAGDSSSAAPLVAAWAIFIKKRSKMEKMDKVNASIIKNYISGIKHENQNDLYIFQDPIAYAEFPIFEEGYGDGLIIPKKFSDY